MRNHGGSQNKQRDEVSVGKDHSNYGEDYTSKNYINSLYDESQDNLRNKLNYYTTQEPRRWTREGVYNRKRLPNLQLVR